MREATQQLDTLTSFFEEAKHSGATAKALQFAEVANSAAATQKIVLPGVVSGLYGDMASSNGFEIDLMPPQLETRDMQDQLDALMEVEEAKRVLCLLFYCSASLVHLHAVCWSDWLVLRRKAGSSKLFFSSRRSLKPRRRH